MALKIGLVGCGAIGSEMAKYIDREEIFAELVAVCDRNEERARAMIESMQRRPRLADLEELAEISDLVVEAASQKAVPAVARAALAKGRDLMIMSVGALMEKDLCKMIRSLAEEKGGRVFIPSGAVSGLDGLKSASQGKIDCVTLTTTKHPRGLEGAPYILENGIDLQALKKATLIFQGPASLAVLAFPANVNVAATLSLAYGSDVFVNVVADPDITVNMHEIVIEGDFGRSTTRVENVPSPQNPRTSYLAALSAIATLRSITESVRIGT